MATEKTGATGLAGRYAISLYDLAESKDAVDQVADDLRALAVAIAESDDLARMISSPVIPRTEQGAAIGALMAQAGAHELTQNFVGVAAANRRLFVLPDIIDDFLRILAGRRGEMTAEVTSAQPLSERQADDLVTALQSALGGKITLNPIVDAEVLGGLVVRIGSQMVDSSLQTKLQQLRLAMRGVG